MKRSHSTGERTVVRPIIPATSNRPETAAEQAPEEPVAAAPLEPAATGNAPMTFRGPFAYIPKPPAMQDSEMQSSPASSSSSVQDGLEHAAITSAARTPASEAVLASGTANCATPEPLAVDDNPHGLAPLILAAGQGNLARLHSLLQNPAPDVNQRNRTLGIPALMAAASNGHVTVLAPLIAAGADLDLVSSTNGCTALMFAAARNQPNAVKCLLAARAKVNLAHAENSATALIVAAKNRYVEVLKMLLTHKDIAVDQTNASGLSALHIAARNDKPEVVACLLAAGANVNLAGDKNRFTALMLAAGQGYVEVVKTLLTHKDIALDLTDTDGESALHIAVGYEETEVVACLLAARAGMTLPSGIEKAAIEFAFENEQAAVVEALLLCGVTLPGIDYGEGADTAFSVTLADFEVEQKLPADMDQNPQGLADPRYLDQPLVVIDELIAAIDSKQDLPRSLRAKGIRMACALPVVDCLGTLAATWPKLASSGQAAGAYQKRLVCAAALSRLSVLAAEGKALAHYQAAGISAAGLARLSAVATRQIEKMIAVSEQVLTSLGGVMLDKLVSDCLARTNASHEVEMAAMNASLVSAGWLPPLAQAIAMSWKAALAALESEPVSIPAGSTMKQITQLLCDNIERTAPRIFAQALQRELAAPTLLAALRTWIGNARSAEGLDLLFQIQCDQLRQYCEQIVSAG